MTSMMKRVGLVTLGMLAVVSVGCDRERLQHQENRTAPKQQAFALVRMHEFTPIRPEEYAGYFGTAVAVHGDSVAVGASGETFVYERTDGKWAEQQRLTIEGSLTYFGEALAFNEDALIVGARGDEDTGWGAHGAVYAYGRDGGQWKQVQRLTANDEAYSFGAALAADGESLVIGAPGSSAVYVYAWQDGAWKNPQKLVSEADHYNTFGASVALSNDTILVGGGDFQDRPAAYVFVRDGQVWKREATLRGDETLDNFGEGVTISGNVAAVATRRSASASDARLGIHVFTRENGLWLNRQILETTTARGGQFHLQIGNGLLVAGAPYGGDDGGIVRLFEGSPGAIKLTHSVGNYNVNDLLGQALALDGRRVLVGAPSGSSYSAPRAYLFEVGCKNDSHCGAGHYCAAGGNCYPAKALGSRCDVAPGVDCKEPNCAACGNASCVDGVCCDRQCAGPCDTCAKSSGASEDGHCTILPAGMSGTPDCGALTCNGESSICSQCLRDSDCAQGKYCASEGTCQPQKEQAATCDDREGKDCKQDECRVCKNGACRDGFCCDSGCFQTCVACARALTGEVDGKCAPILAGTDPQDECDAHLDFPFSCRADGFCDGAGACRAFAPKNTACGQTTCSEGAISGMLCDGEGKCGPGELTCEPYTCNGDVCATACATTEDCVPDSFCLSGACVDKRQNGAVCAEKSECASDFCVDGVCCDEPCTGQCEACGEPSSVGHCIAVAGAPRGSRAPCAAEDPACAGECNGTETKSCSYPDASRTCDKTCNGDREAESACNGQGACAAQSERSCGAYRCRDNSCLLSCDKPGDCIDGYSCVASNCVPTGGPKCSDDGNSSIGFNGITQCEPYLCDSASGTCRQSCTVATDCQIGYVCDAEDKLCIAAVTPSSRGADEGCSCSMPGNGRRGYTLETVLPFIVLVLRRMRRKARLLSA